MTYFENFQRIRIAGDTLQRKNRCTHRRALMILIRLMQQRQVDAKEKEYRLSLYYLIDLIDI